MTESLNALFAATVLFVGGHFLLSSLPVRKPMIRRLGAQGFRAVYSIVVIVAFVWMLMAYGNAPFVPVWEPPLAFRWIPLVLMPVATILLVCALTTRSPTMMGGDAPRRGEPASFDPVPGVLRITRHPMLWSFALWAGCHLLVTGHAASLVLMGGILVLAAGGMNHIDQRRAGTMGADWGPIALTTSVLPFAAILSKRTSFDWAGIGWWRLLLGIAVYLALLYLHPAAFGVSPLPA